MREILFRGKSAKTGEWIYGYFVNCTGRYDDPSDTVPEIIEVGADRSSGGFYDPLDVYSVNPETVGQWTGLVDKNGKKIFEGDVLDTPRWVVTYLANTRNGFGMNAGWYVQRDNFESWSELECVDDHVVLGNIHDNPELLGR